MAEQYIENNIKFVFDAQADSGSEKLISEAFKNIANNWGLSNGTFKSIIDSKDISASDADSQRVALLLKIITHRETFAFLLTSFNGVFDVKWFDDATRAKLNNELNNSDLSYIVNIASDSVVKVDYSQFKSLILGADKVVSKWIEEYNKEKENKQAEEKAAEEAEKKSAEEEARRAEEEAKKAAEEAKKSEEEAKKAAEEAKKAEEGAKKAAEKDARISSAEDETGDEDNISEEEKKQRDELLDVFMKVYSGNDPNSAMPLSAAIRGVEKSMVDLYQSCFSGISTPDGILTKKGLLSFDKVGDTYKFVYNHSGLTGSEVDKMNSSDPRKLKYLTNKGVYGQYYNAIMYAIGVTLGAKSAHNSTDKERSIIVDEAIHKAELAMGDKIDGRKSTVPQYKDCIHGKHYYPRLHTEFMTGKFKCSTDMNDWATTNKVRRNNVRVTSFDDIIKWIRLRVGRCMSKALMDAGLKIEDVGTNDSEVSSICKSIAANIKNIIVITNYKKSFFTVKICTGMSLNADSVALNLANYFNEMSSGSKSVEIVKKNSGDDNGVIEFDVVLNREAYDASSTLSADVIDDIIESGQVPSWNSVILGEKLDGTTEIGKFRKQGSSLTIYGASGSGKGVMTSALLSSALAEGAALFYFDGKPDNGAAFAKIAWDSGIEAPVFNGCQGGSDVFEYDLEEFSHGIRPMSLRTNEIAKIPVIDNSNNSRPAWPFANETNRRMLYEVSLTLQGFQFAHDVILKRCKDENLEILGNNDKRWAVIVIDEIQDAYENEATIRKIMKEYMDVVGKEEIYEEVTDARGNTKTKKVGRLDEPRFWNKDPGYVFCKQWLNWADNLCPSWSNIVTKSLRNSNTTLITIFQSNDWFISREGIKDGKILKLMLGISAKTTRIVGKGALKSSNRWGDGKSTSYTWYEKEVQKSKWAISEVETPLEEDNDIFKPFQVFTTDLGFKVKCPPDDIGAGAGNCYLTKEEKGAPDKKKPIGVQSYIRYLFNGLHDEMVKQIEEGKRLPGTETPEGVLKASFDYFNRLFDNNLIHYMYDIPPISGFSGSMSDEQISDIEAADRATMENSDDNELDALNSDIASSEGAGIAGVENNRMTDAELKAAVIKILDMALRGSGKTISERKYNVIVVACMDYLRKRGY